MISDKSIQEVKAVRLMQGQPYIDYHYVILCNGEIKLEDAYDIIYDESLLLTDKTLGNESEAMDYLEEFYCNLKKYNGNS